MPTVLGVEQAASVGVQANVQATIDLQAALSDAALAAAHTTVNQLYRECLDAHYKRAYWETSYGRTTWWAKIYDFLIGLGSAASGGTGLGILANPSFAWVCASITTVSVFLSVAKGVWGWSEKSKFSLDRIQFYDKLSSDYKSLVDEVTAAKQWDADFADRRTPLKQNSYPGTPDPYAQLRQKIKNRIQAEIKASLRPNLWWAWKEES